MNWGGNVAEEPTSGVSFRRSNELELLTDRLGDVRLLRAVDIILNHFDHAERSDEEEFNKPDVPAGDSACLTEIVRTAMRISVVVRRRNRLNDRQPG